MKLNYRITGESDEKLVICHGLFGSGGNWQSVAKELGNDMRVVAPDLRNHGRSPHDSDTGYEAMTVDLAELMGDLGFRDAGFIGHSMGGKAAMMLALTRPSLVRRLVIVDIAPKPYPPYHRKILDALLALEKEPVSSRTEAEEFLRPEIPDASVRAFLLTNLVREHGRYRFRINLEALSSGYSSIAGWPEKSFVPFEKPALFIRGSLSNYIEDSDTDRICSLFPSAGFITIPGASHWVHAEKPGEFLSVVRKFLSERR